jgi:alanyl-tRNA synthetase
MHDEGESVLRVTGLSPVLGAPMKGRVDWPRRLDHIQQHGQHILSQAFITFNADAQLRMMKVARSTWTGGTNKRADRRAVELANNGSGRIDQSRFGRLQRKRPRNCPCAKSGREGELRLIEIEGFDLTLRRTHAITPARLIIAARSWNVGV